MSIGNIIIILLFIIGIFFGYKYGFFSIMVYSTMLFISVLLSGLINKIVSNLLYFICPFFNFSGDLTGVKTINILLYRIFAFVLFIVFFMVLLDKLLVKFKIKDKIINHMVESGLISQIFGAVFSLFISYIVIFILILVLVIPCFNIKIFNDSTFSNIIIEKMPLLSSEYSKIYNASIKSSDVIKNYEKEEFENKNDEIKQILIDNKVISEKKLNKLKKKLKGHLPKVIDLNEEEKKKEKENQEKDEEFEDEYIDDDEYYDDEEEGEEYFDDENWDDEDWDDEEWED